MSSSEMDSNLNKRCHHKFDKVIPIVREKLMKFRDEKSTCDDMYNEDIADAMNNDFTIRRFLVLNDGKPEAALASLLDAFRWYKKMSFRDMKDDYFPAEVYQVGAVFPYEPDKDGRSTIYVRMKCSPRIPELVDAIKHYVSFLLWKVDQESRERGWVVITDFEGSSFSGWDLDFARYFVIVMRYYFPTGLHLKICVDIGIVWRGLWIVMKDILPKRFSKILIFLPRDKLTKYVANENIPRFIGGTCKRPFNGLAVVPNGAPSGVHFAENVLGLNRKNFDFRHIVEKILNENKREEELAASLNE